MGANCGGHCLGQPDGERSPHLVQKAGLNSAYVSEFTVPRMDCYAEERIIRLSLDGMAPSVALEFDIPNHRVKIFHEDNLDDIEKRMELLDLEATLSGTKEIGAAFFSNVVASANALDKQEAAILKGLLAINATMFVAELSVGWFAQSTGLIADSLDMFADAAVYALALYAVGRSVRLKLRAAHLSGWLQVLLALGALSEVVRHFMFGSEPVSAVMMGMGAVALFANSVCLVLISKNKEGGAHMKASWIFSANDVIANLGVILAGALVAWTGSRYPDLVIGTVIAVIVLSGARRILQLKT